MVDTSLADDLALAHLLADRAAAVTVPLFRQGVEARAKPDGSPVTDADVAAEEAMLTVLARERPGDAVLSEESGASGSGSRRWILDPVDGTFNLLRGDLAWGTHVALERDGEVVVAVVTRPAREPVQRWWAVRGGGSHRTLSNGSAVPLHVSAVGELSRCHVSLWAGPDEDPPRVWADLVDRAVPVEPTMDDVLKVAAGELDVVVDAMGAPWDQAPVVLLVEEAGGRFRDGAGGRDLARLPGVYTNGRVDLPAAG